MMNNSDREIISLWIKEELSNANVSTACYYEGCGSDDGWPNIKQ